MLRRNAAATALEYSLFGPDGFADVATGAVFPRALALSDAAELTAGQHGTNAC